MKVVEVFFKCGQIDKKFRKVFQFDLNQINKINNENESKISDFFYIGVNIGCVILWQLPNFGEYPRALVRSQMRMTFKNKHGLNKREYHTTQTLSECE